LPTAQHPRRERRARLPPGRGKGAAALASLFLGSASLDGILDLAGTWCTIEPPPIHEDQGGAGQAQLHGSHRVEAQLRGGRALIETPIEGYRIGDTSLSSDTRPWDQADGILVIEKEVMICFKPSLAGCAGRRCGGRLRERVDTGQGEVPMADGNLRGMFFPQAPQRECKLLAGWALEIGKDDHHSPTGITNHFVVGDICPPGLDEYRWGRSGTGFGMQYLSSEHQGRDDDSTDDQGADHGVLDRVFGIHQ